MSQLGDIALTIPEAAFVTGVPIRAINHEIDERVIQPSRSGGTRRVQGADLLYLSATRTVRLDLKQRLRRRVRSAIGIAWSAKADVATVDWMQFQIRDIEQGLLQPLARLHNIRQGVIETRADVLAGEPVLRGTRIAARHIADLVKLGASPQEVAEDLEVSISDVEAAVLFDRVTPRMGRPRAIHARESRVPAAR